MRQLVGVAGAGVTVPLRFDYDELPEAVRSVARETSVAIVSALEDANRNVYEAGELLQEQKRRIPDGTWLKWLTTELGWSERKAQMVMSIPARLTRDEYVALARDLPDSALYELAAESTPPEALERVRERLDNDERLTVRDVKRIAREAKPAPVVTVETALRQYARTHVVDLAEMTVEEAAALVGRPVSADVLDAAVDNIAADTRHRSHVPPAPPRVQYVEPSTSPPAATEADLWTTLKMPRRVVDRLKKWGDGDPQVGLMAAMQVMFANLYGTEATATVWRGSRMYIVAYDVDGQIADEMEVTL